MCPTRIAGLRSDVLFSLRVHYSSRIGALQLDDGIGAILSFWLEDASVWGIRERHTPTTDGETRRTADQKLGDRRNVPHGSSLGYSVRFTSINKPQPYINVEAYGGNLHVSF